MIQCKSMTQVEEEWMLPKDGLLRICILFWGEG